MDLVIFGAGQLAEVVSVYIRAHSDIEIVGYTVDQKYLHAERFQGLPLVAWEQLEQHFPPDKVMLFGPISFRDGNRFRRKRYEQGLERGYRFYSFVHPSCHIYTEQIGTNVLILEGNTLQPFTTIGDNCVLWSNNHIGHHTRIGAHCFLAGHVGIGGNTEVGEGVFFAGKSGASDNLKIGNGCLLSFGALATYNLPDGAVLAAPKMRMSKNAAHRAIRKMLG